MSQIINAKEEFLETTRYFKVVAAIIQFGDSYSYSSNPPNDIFKLNPLYTKDDYENFLKFLDRDYNSSYGGQELFGTIYCEDGLWFDRGEYDGFQCGIPPVSDYTVDALF